MLVNLIGAHPKLKATLWRLAHAAQASEFSRKKTTLHSGNVLELSPRARTMLHDLQSRKAKKGGETR